MPIIEAKSNVNVVTGILKKQKFFLITTRPKGKSFAEFWEFPGGKVEKNESLKPALSRELREELSIQTSQKSFTLLDNYRYKLSDKIVNLYFFICDRWNGKIRPNENQEFKWVSKKNFCNYNFLPSNNKIITLLSV